MTTTPTSTDRYPVAAMTAIVLASLVVLMDTTFIVLALPEISADLGSGAEWAIPVFLMAMGISQLAAGWACRSLRPEAGVPRRGRRLRTVRHRRRRIGRASAG